VDELLSIAERYPDTAGLARLLRLDWAFRTEGPPRELESELPQMLDRLARSGDERGLALAHMTAWGMYWMRSLATPAGEHARLVAEHAGNARDDGLRSLALRNYLHALEMGPTPAATLAAELDLIEGEATGPVLEGFVAIGRAKVERLEGNFDKALDHAARAVELLEAVNSTEVRAAHAIVADIHVAAGNPAAALPGELRTDASFAEREQHVLRSTTQAVLAELYEALGDRDAALAAVDLSDQLSPREDVINFAITHRVRAQLALADGDGERAERWARSAVDNAFLTDFVSYQGAAKLELARVLARLGRRDEAEVEAREALAIYEAKGDRPGMAQAQAVLGAL
jgi:tetratricopeptide (TPR) repeat protein